MNQTIEGTYKDGVVVLDRLPEDVAEARVAVVFVRRGREEPTGRRRGIARLGIFAPAEGNFTSDEELDRAKGSWNATTDEWGQCASWCLTHTP